MSQLPLRYGMNPHQSPAQLYTMRPKLPLTGEAQAALAPGERGWLGMSARCLQTSNIPLGVSLLWRESLANFVLEIVGKNKFCLV